MDLLDFDVNQLYFEEPIHPEAQQCIDQAAEAYGQTEAEFKLMRAYFLEPQHPLVLVALYRYFYYQHRYLDGLLVAERVLRLFAQRLDLNEQWQDLTEEQATQVNEAEKDTLTWLRFYLFALKGAAYLEARLGHYDTAILRLEKVLLFDREDRLGVKSLLVIFQNERDEQGN